MKFGEAPEPKDVQQFSPENDPFGFKRTAFNEVIKAHMKKKEIFSEQSSKLFGTIQGQCTDRLWGIIEKDQHFNEWFVEKDHQRLWIRIRDIYLNDAATNKRCNYKKT